MSALNVDIILLDYVMCHRVGKTCVKMEIMEKMERYFLRLCSELPFLVFAFLTNKKDNLLHRPFRKSINQFCDCAHT